MASVKDLGNGKYRVYFCVNNRRSSKTITAKNKKDAERQGIIMEEKIKETGSLDRKTKKEKESMYIVDLSERYMEYLMKRPNKIAEKTREKYEVLFKNNIIPYFKGYRVIEVGVLEVEKFIWYLGTPKAKIRKKHDKDTYDSSTISEIVKLLSGMLSKAVDWEIIESNPCDKVDMPVVEEKEIILYNDIELVELLTKLDEYTENQIIYGEDKGEELPRQKRKVMDLSKRLIVNIAVRTTARRGEVLALTRDDIDLVNRQIEFNKALLYTNGKKSYVRNRLKHGERKTIPIGDDLVQMIEEYYKELDILFEMANGEIKVSGRLFITMRKSNKTQPGDYQLPDPVSEWFKSFLRKKNLREISFHKLRSSGLSYLANNGMDIHTLAKIAGHSSIEPLMKYYIDIYDSSKRQIVDKFGELHSRVELSKKLDIANFKVS